MRHRLPDSFAPDEAGPSSRPWVVIHPDADSLALAVAAVFVENARWCVKARGRFTVALAGGSTPRRAYELLAQPTFADLIPWADVHVFWGDERCVDPDDPRRNERMAREALLDHVPIPLDHVHPVSCGREGAGRQHQRDSSAEGLAREAADDYEALLRRLFPGTQPAQHAELSGQGIPCPNGLDLVLLGLGVDGHTASLFPGSEALWLTDHLAAAVFVDGEAGIGTTAAGYDLWRVTLTAPFINLAESVVFIVGGSVKAAIVSQVLEAPPDPVRLPAQLVRPKNGNLSWYLDEDSAFLLSKSPRKE